MSNFTADWVVEDSFKGTLRSLMAIADPGVFASLSPEQIADVLINELRFTAPYNEKEMQEAEEYLLQRGRYGREVISHIALQLQLLGSEKLRRIAQEVAQLAGEKAAALDLTDRLEVLAVATAARMVSHPDATDVIRCLMGFMADVKQEEKETVARIVTHLLPFNYAPGVIRKLTEHVKQGQLGLVEDTVSTHTLAEVIMAGYDGKEPEYTRPLDLDDMRGKTAIDYQEGPEEGPGDSRSPQSSILRAARNLLTDILALKGTILEPWKPVTRPGVNGDDEAELQRDIDDCATKLRGRLKALSTMNKGRTAYCVLQLPEKTDRHKTYQRQFRLQVLREVARHVPELLFVELVRPRPDREHEFELEGYLKYIYAHVLPL